MASSTHARRYATALFEAARDKGQLDVIGRDLNAMRDLVASHPLLRQVFESTAVPAAKKRAILDAIIAAGGGISAESHRLLDLLADRDELAHVPDIATTYGAKAREASRAQSAEVVTAVPLDDASRAAITTALSHATGAHVTVAERVDPSIIGGLVARVGGMVFDASMTRQLERLRQTLVGQS